MKNNTISHVRENVNFNKHFKNTGLYQNTKDMSMVFKVVAWNPKLGSTQIFLNNRMNK